MYLMDASLGRSEVFVGYMEGRGYWLSAGLEFNSSLDWESSHIQERPSVQSKTWVDGWGQVGRRGKPARSTRLGNKSTSSTKLLTSVPGLLLCLSSSFALQSVWTELSQERHSSASFSTSTKVKLVKDPGRARIKGTLVVSS